MSLLDNLVPTLYLASAVLFILGLKGLTRVKTARRGNILSSSAMLVAVIATLIEMACPRWWRCSTAPAVALQPW